MGYIPVDQVNADDGFEIEVIGMRRVAHLQREPLFDPTGALMRA